MSLSEKFLGLFEDTKASIKEQEMRLDSLEAGMGRLKRERTAVWSDEIKRDRLTAEIESYEEKIKQVEEKIARLKKVQKEKAKSTNEAKIEVPAGKWKHLRVSAEWEKNNDNDAKGKVGSFSSDKTYLTWTSDDGKASKSIQVKDMQAGGASLHIKAKSGLEYWFQKAQTNESSDKYTVTYTNIKTGKVVHQEMGRAAQYAHRKLKDSELQKNWDFVPGEGYIKKIKVTIEKEKTNDK